MKQDRPGSRSSRPWLRLIGLGMELAAFTLVFTAIGYWIDWSRQHDTPYATALLALIGFVLGMVRFIVQSTRQSQ